MDKLYSSSNAMKVNYGVDSNGLSTNNYGIIGLCKYMCSIGGLTDERLDKLQQLFVLAGPLTVTAVIQQAANVSNFVFIGHMPVQEGDMYSVATYMGAATLGNMMCNVTGYTLTYGMTAALDTLLSQAYGGKKYRLLGIHTQKSVIILTLLSFLVGFIWMHTEEILHYGLNIDLITAQLAGTWSKVLVYSLWPTVMFEILKKFLQNQKILWPIVTATVLGTVINIIANYVFIFQWQWGFLGAAYTMVVMQWSVLILMLGFICMRKWYVLSVLRPQQQKQRQVQLATDLGVEMEVGVTGNMGSGGGGSGGGGGNSGGSHDLGVYIPVPFSVSDTSDNNNSNNSNSNNSNHTTGCGGDIEMNMNQLHKYAMNKEECSSSSGSGSDSSEPECAAAATADDGVVFDEVTHFCHDNKEEAGVGMIEEKPEQEQEEEEEEEEDPECNWPTIIFFSSSPSPPFSPQNMSYSTTATTTATANVDAASSASFVYSSSDNNTVRISVLFQHWGEFMALGLPSAASMFIEWGSYELSAAIAGQLHSSDALAVHSIFMTLASIVFMFPNSIAGAAALLAGEALGANTPLEAQKFINLGLIIDYLSGGVMGALLYCLRLPISHAFTGDPVIQQLTYHLLPIMSIYVTADACGCITIALLRSVGRPLITVVVNMSVCISILLPLGYYLAVDAGFGLKGLWGAMALAWFLASCVYLMILMRTDWTVEALEAAKRNSM